MRIPDAIYAAVESDLTYAVQAAINAGATPKEFVTITEMIWETELRERLHRLPREFASTVGEKP